MLERRAVVARILKDRGDALVVTGLGSTTWDTAAAGDNPNNLYLWGGMGGAASCALGLALAQPQRRVLVLTGDGEMLMGLGSLATIAVQKPANLAVCVIDNERYGETGMQATHTASGVNLAKVAQACGFRVARQVRSLAQVAALRRAIHATRGPVFAQVKVRTEKLPLVLPPRDGGLLKSRFRKALLGEGADLD